MPQQQRTKPIDAAELPDLEPRDQEFVRLVAIGKSASDAFRATRDCGDWLPQSVWAAASRLRSDDKVQAWLDAAKLAGLASCAVTYEGHLQELDRLKALCIKSGNMGAAVACEQTRGKAAGLHIDRVQEVPLDPVQTLKDIARDQPEIAASLAAQAGIPWADIDDSKRTLN
jgi:hypothetical protein